MLSNKSILLFSAPVKSGKTSALFNWIKNKENVQGVLTPDIDGKRMLFDIFSQTYHDFESNNVADNSLYVFVGKYSFYKSSFQLANKILMDSMQMNPDWLIVDEVGKLECERQEGLHSSVLLLINHYKNPLTKGKLLLVIRETLLEKCIQFYGLQDAEVWKRLPA